MAQGRWKWSKLILVYLNILDFEKRLIGVYGKYHSVAR